MTSLSIATKLWLPVTVLSLLITLLTLLSIRRIQNAPVQAKNSQQEQQTKLELALRWHGLTEANVTQVAAGILSGDFPAALSALKGTA